MAPLLIFFGTIINLPICQTKRVIDFCVDCCSIFEHISKEQQQRHFAGKFCFLLLFSSFRRCLNKCVCLRLTHFSLLLANNKIGGSRQKSSKCHLKLKYICFLIKPKNDCRPLNCSSLLRPALQPGNRCLSGGHLLPLSTHTIVCRLASRSS